jgi:outer membrane protein TolC
MKRLLLPLILLTSWVTIGAQSRDLNYYLNQAKLNSPLLQKNRNATQVLELDLKQTERILKSPEVNLESNILFAPIISHTDNSNRLDVVSGGADRYSGYDLGITNGGQYQAFVTVKQPLFTGSSYRSYTAKAAVSRQINQNESALSVHEIEQLVGYQYLLCLKSKAQIENGKSMFRLMNDKLSILKKLVASAIYKQTDLLLLQIEYQNYESDAKSAQEDYRNNLYDLNLLCGVKDNATIDIQEIDLSMKEESRADSQFLISYRLDSLGILADQSISELKYKPQLSLFANAGLNAVNIPSWNRLGFSTGLTFTWNIYDGGQRKLERQKSVFNLQTLQFEKNHFLTQNELNKAKIKHQLTALSERSELLSKQLERYDQLYEVYQKEFEQGLVSVMDFKNLLKDITAKKQESILLKMEKQVLVNSYNYWNY